MAPSLKTGVGCVGGTAAGSRLPGNGDAARIGFDGYFSFFVQTGLSEKRRPAVALGRESRWERRRLPRPGRGGDRIGGPLVRNTRAPGRVRAARAFK